jgi:putative oxidoreductase
MLDRLPTSLFRSRFPGPAEYLSLLLRVGAGGFVVLAGIGKFVDHAHEVDEFRDFGVPLPELAVPFTGAVEVVGGVLVVIGLLTRVGALAVAATLVGALLTAGINEGGTFHLVVGPTVMVGMLLVAWLGGGIASVDRRIAAVRDAGAPADA